MLGITDLKVGTFFELDRAPHQVIAAEHSKMGRGGAVLRTKVRNLKTGAIYERTFRGGESFEESDIARRKGQFLYNNPTSATFMESDTFAQYTLAEERIGADINYLVDGLEVDLILYNNQILAIQLPAKVELSISYTEPGFKGDTQSAAMKPATLETGLIIQVPLFIKSGDKVRINTATGQYVERVNE
ncbi:elongation factor P [Candidatus Berkelbacteria bacterium]|nr:elongation factor P [Candidatus Berkelbacteria bacterium]